MNYVGFLTATINQKYCNQWNGEVYIYTDFLLITYLMQSSNLDFPTPHIAFRLIMALTASQVKLWNIQKSL